MKPLLLVSASLAVTSTLAVGLVAGLATANQTQQSQNRQVLNQQVLNQQAQNGSRIQWRSPQRSFRPVLRPAIQPPVQNLSTLYTAMETAAESVEEKPVSGLFVQGEGEEARAFPLKHTDVVAEVQGNVSRVEVTQTFENPYDEPLEAVYVFPLPDEAAVDDMEIRIGDRVIKGDIKRREEAQEIYDQAVAEGRTAGLLEQERANIFTQSLANIKPGESIDVTIRYTESLKFEGNSYEFVFPMVVGPRYIPGDRIDPKDRSNKDTDQVPDASRITPPVLRPGQRSGHDINVTVTIDAGVPLKAVESTSHKIKMSDVGGKMQVQLAGGDTIPNKDLVLRYNVKGRETQTTVLSQRDDRGGHFALYLVPAVDYRADEIVPKDVVFLMDTSGSQRGEPLAQSKALMRRFINGLNPNDTFTIIDFANTATKLSEKPLANTIANRKRALQYIERLQANGGTELMNGLNEVLSYPKAREGRLRSVVLLTDGYVGNDQEAIARIQKGLEPGNRLYSFGVGSSTNRFLLNRLAEVGRGTVQVVRQDEDTQPVVDKFFKQINRPVLTDVQVEWLGRGADPVLYPKQAPDLFDQQPLVLFGRKEDAKAGRVKVTGRLANGQRYEEIMEVDFDDSNNPAIGQLWGRARIKDLMNGMYGGETTEGVEAVTNTSLAYRLLSKYTAFVAVSEEVRVDPDGTRRTVQVPVELPEGVSYEGIFGDDQAAGFANAAGNMRTSARLMAPSQMMGQPRVFGGNASLPKRPPVAPLPVVKPVPTAADRAAEPEVAELAIVSKVTVARAEGLDAGAIASLEKHLKSLKLSGNAAGELVFELRVRRGRVQLVALDEAGSSVGDAQAVNLVRETLKRWRPDAGLTAKVRLVLQVQ